MQFLTSLFGGSGESMIGAILALGIVLVLIVLSVWLLKFVFRTSENVVRGRNRRLNVVESLQLDPRRQMLIVRRDDVEHVILTGGPQDMVIESGIPVVEAETPQRRPLPPPAVNDETPPYFRPGAPDPDLEIDYDADFAEPPAAPRPPTAGTATSLRHTGLMRASRMEVIPGSLDKAPRDSAKNNPFLEAEGDGAEFERDFKAGGKS